MGGRIAAVDLFCGVGGMSYGLASAGIDVVAGIDMDGSCRFPFEANLAGAEFIESDVKGITSERLAGLWPEGATRLLAGCAPCQPFSSYRKNVNQQNDSRWLLLLEFGRLIRETRPDLVTTENVHRIKGKAVFGEFVDMLEGLGYSVDSAVRNCVDYGIAQNRRRMVLVASLIGDAVVPKGDHSENAPKTVRQAISHLPAIESGGMDEVDPMHRSPAMSEINLQRMEASKPGGTWHDWPEDLRLPCHRRPKGAKFVNAYGRMRWDKPSPTITTYFYNFGAGRFGHPEQHRSISPREAAILQGFPDTYRFAPDGEKAAITTIGRQIGNAVPPPLAEAIGRAFLNSRRA